MPRSKQWMVANLAAALWTASNAAAIDAKLPPTESEGAIAYVSGGLDRQQAQTIEREARKYSLELDFLPKGKAYGGPPAYVPVTIRDDAGHLILDRAADGPLMLVQLPEGTYKVTAQNEGKSETVDVTIAPGKHKTLAFNWKG
jgi:hypothetical protein